jgi:tetratricopeptide (TPR) repeat protein
MSFSRLRGMIGFKKKDPPAANAKNSTGGKKSAADFFHSAKKKHGFLDGFKRMGSSMSHVMHHEKKLSDEDVHSIHHVHEEKHKSLLANLTPGFARVKAALHIKDTEGKKRKKNASYKVASPAPIRRKSMDGEDEDAEKPVILGRYEQALKTNPDDLEALEHLGVFLVGTDDGNKCIEVLSKAIDLGSKSVNVLKALGQAHFLMWRKNTREDAHLIAAYKAYEHCCRVMAKQKNIDESLQADVLLELAWVYFFYGTYEGALKMLANVMMEVPLYNKMDEAMILNAACLWRLELYQESIKYWEHVMNNPPDPYKARHVVFIIGRMYQKLGRLPDASQAFEETFAEMRKKNFIPYDIQTTRTFVNTPDTWVNMGKLHMEQGFWEQAIDMILEGADKAKDIDAQFGVEDYDREKLKDLYLSLFKCYTEVGNHTKALKALDSAHTAQPYDHVVRALLLEHTLDEDQLEKWTHYFDVEERFSVKLQKIFRGNRGRAFARKNIKFENETVTKIQRRFRGLRTRRRFLKTWKVLKARNDRVVRKRNQAILKVQACLRMFNGRCRYLVQRKSLITIQSSFRGMMGRSRAMRARAAKMEKVNERRRRAAVQIQSSFRGFRLRMVLHRQWAAIDIQAAVRGFMVRRKVLLTKSEPQLVRTGKSGFPKGTPGHYRHWMKRLEQSEHLFADRLEMRMKIGLIQQAHPSLSAEAAYCAMAETAGDIGYAIELIDTDISFADDLFDICETVDVAKYIQLRPAPILGPISELRTKRNLSRRWMQALQTTSGNTAKKVKEIAESEDEERQRYLAERGRYREVGSAALPWQRERYNSPSRGAASWKPKTTKEGRSIENQLRAVLTPERTRMFQAGTSQRLSQQAMDGTFPTKRLFSHVDFTRNRFEETLLDTANELQGEPAKRYVKVGRSRA